MIVLDPILLELDLKYTRLRGSLKVGTELRARLLSPYHRILSQGSSSDQINERRTQKEILLEDETTRSSSYMDSVHITTPVPTRPTEAASQALNPTILLGDRRMEIKQVCAGHKRPLEIRD